MRERELSQSEACTMCLKKGGKVQPKMCGQNCKGIQRLNSQ